MNKLFEKTTGGWNWKKIYLQLTVKSYELERCYFLLSELSYKPLGVRIFINYKADETFFIWFKDSNLNDVYQL